MTIDIQDVTPADLASIERAATDYIEAWLTADPERMAGCLHPDLVKRSIGPDEDSAGPQRVWTMTQAEMVEATANRKTNIAPGYEVVIFDSYRNTATARVDSSRYMDYLHLARFEDRWRIVNVMWAPKPAS